MLALRNGDDVKTVQTLLGHKTPDFKLNVYAYTPDAAKKDSASRMDACIRELTKGS
jgi:integrase